MKSSGVRSRLAALETASITCLCLLLISCMYLPPAGSFQTFPLPTARSEEPDGITAGRDGNLWFTEFEGNNIGNITT